MNKLFRIIFISFICTLLIGCSCTNKDIEKPTNEVEKENTIKLFTDDTKLVFDNNGAYKIVLYHDGNTVNKVEHYYKYADFTAAKKEYDNAKTKYISDANIKNITLNGIYVIYQMDESIYEGKTIEEIQKTYSYMIPVYEK